MDASDARKAHKILDDLLKGKMVLDEEREFLRQALPELPKQKTLQEITEHVCDAWKVAIGIDWDGYSYAADMSIDDWLWELYEQLKGIKDAPAIEPAHPEFLETEADYENAPNGTIVAKDSSGSVCVKTCLWPDMMVPTVKRRILRWGWGSD